MTLRHMRIFICVCDENNMTKAAAKLHMTQPSVSMAIQELESHYNLRLFERLGHRLFLTEAGRRLLTYARHIVNLDQQAEFAMRNLGELTVLRIGASVTIGEAVLVDVLRHMSKTNPRQEILSEVHNTAELETMVLRDELDMALVEGKVESEYLTVRPFMEDELIFIAAPDNELLKKSAIGAADLESQRFFVRERGSGTRDLLENVLQQHDIKPQICGVYNNAETIKKAVLSGLGISVISRQAVRHELACGSLASFTVKYLSFKRNFSIVYHKNKYISPALSAMIDIFANFEGITKK